MEEEIDIQKINEEYEKLKRQMLFKKDRTHHQISTPNLSRQFTFQDPSNTTYT